MTALMREGDNALGALLGDGWYRGYSEPFRLACIRCRLVTRKGAELF